MKAPELHSEAPFFTVSYTRTIQRELFERHFKVIKIISGHALFTAQQHTLCVKSNEYAFVTPGGFSKIKMFPAKNQAFRLICLNFTDKIINKHVRLHSMTGSPSHKMDCFEKIRSDAWLDALFASLYTYCNKQDQPDNNLLRIKQEECLYILSQRHPDLYLSLYAKRNHQRQDLNSFMEKNYMYNAPLERFAELSGRSLSTFRRECMELSGMTPAQWITEKRLEKAYQKLTQENCHPSAIFNELGFETLAHFSRKFKQRYGFPPSKAKPTATETPANNGQAPLCHNRHEE